MHINVIISGSRHYTDPRLVDAAVQASGFEVTTVISGGCRGVDQLAERWAAERGIPVVRYPAEWARYGLSAGYRRNRQMAAAVAVEGGALIAIWDGVSRGTNNMIQVAREHGLAVYVHAPSNVPDCR